MCSIVVTDFNDDTRLDIVGITCETGGIQVFLGKDISIIQILFALLRTTLQWSYFFVMEMVHLHIEENMKPAFPPII